VEGVGIFLRRFISFSFLRVNVYQYRPFYKFGF
jgi:hypothetical protein